MNKDNINQAEFEVRNAIGSFLAEMNLARIKPIATLMFKIGEAFEKLKEEAIP